MNNRHFTLSRNENDKGFTMIELMVVLVIIAILVAIAIPVYGNLTANAERGVVEATLRNLDGAILLYYAKEGIYPNTDWDGEDYLIGWPSGPNDAVYTISNETPPRAQVTGFVGGVILVEKTLPIQW